MQAASGKTFEVIYPATGEIIGFGANGDAEDVNWAVEDAAAAQKSWGKMRARDRGKLLYECAEALEEHVEELGRLIALETRKGPAHRKPGRAPRSWPTRSTSTAGLARS
ncbi:MAG: aldehyde dehydrogenase family protein [Thalassobaculum sp.]